VGDILEVRSDEPIPADLVVLATSEQGGVSYIETANIDGESNLKVKMSASIDGNGDSDRWGSDEEGLRARRTALLTK
jgi:P-type E1-E2 ATPase